MTGIAAMHSIDFARYFAEELKDLREMEQAGLVEVDAARIRILPAGRLLVRVVAMVFDRHLRNSREEKRYSRVI